MSTLAENRGSLTLGDGRQFNSKSTLTNSGVIKVVDSTVSVANATNYDAVSGRLTGGQWEVHALNGVASLQIGSGPLRVNDAAIVVSGAGATMQGLTSMTENNGSLTFANHTGFSSKQTIANNGLLEVVNAKLMIATSNLATGKLTGGEWRVVASDNDIASLQLGTGGAILTNDATVTLSGVGASFTQIDSVLVNAGSLTFTDGKNFTANKGLVNSGAINVGAGSVLSDSTGMVNHGLVSIAGAMRGSKGFNNIGTLEVVGSTYIANVSTIDVGTTDGTALLTDPANVVNGVLNGGRWAVVGDFDATAVLSIAGQNITTNNAEVLLFGNSHFNMMDTLTLNLGSLEISGGSSQQLRDPVENRGSLIIGEGGMLSTGKLLNNGVMANAGTLFVNGPVTGSGHFSNTGLVLAFDRGAGTNPFNAVFAQSDNVVADPAGQALVGGSWQVAGFQNAVSLQVGSGDIDVNRAYVSLQGPQASMPQLAKLRRNEGLLEVASGATYAITSGLENLGTLVIAQDGQLLLEGKLTNRDQLLFSDASATLGGTLVNQGIVFVDNQNHDDPVVVSIGNTPNLSADGVLTGGSWQVSAGFGQQARLEFIGNGISHNAAEIVLFGEGANIDIFGMVQNSGTLRLYAGAVGYIGNSTGIINTGEVMVDSNARFEVRNSLTNAGSLEINGGTLLAGNLRNKGTVSVGNGGVLTAHSGDVSGGGASSRLGGGTWVVTDEGSGAQLILVSDKIAINDANVVLRGERAYFDQLEGLTANEGSLLIAGWT
ncbi:MAG: hypothetical protein H6978_06350 [Gammaproteobacteria bacterium]|nr:hypothetical protein [Gammaproteobacteria bacterium]